MSAELLAIEALTLNFRTRSGTVQVLDGISLSLRRGETLAVVGESGSGKSVMAFAAMGLLDAAADMSAERMTFEGVNLLSASNRELDDLRGREMAMIFQSPRTALNPIRRVGQQIQDVLRRHQPVARRDARDRAIAALDSVGVPDPARRHDAYPFELSGGLCQRVLIAMALSCRPRLLIADEPTTGLDVTTQATIMDLISDVRRSQQGMGTLLITHDLALAAEYADRIMVMHAGQVVEVAPTDELFRAPAHPYTAGLIAATPTTRSSLASLEAIPGSLPDLRGELPPCRFASRCPRWVPACDSPGPQLESISEDASHQVTCMRPL